MNLLQEFLLKAAERRAQGKCPTCNRQGPFTFKDELSKREFGISGLCQPCQDRIFKPEDET